MFALVMASCAGAWKLSGHGWQWLPVYLLSLYLFVGALFVVSFVGEKVAAGVRRIASPRSDRGAVTSEMAVIMVSFFAGFLLFVVYAGRAGQADNDVRSAAQASARAASLQQTAGQAAAVADSTARANLASNGQSCNQQLAVATDTTNFQPGGTVTVTITCTASMADMVSLNVPASRTAKAAATEVIDTYRSTGEPG